MKLISCYIINFGKLKNFKFDFSDGLNVINEHNGWGKTTFADFIKAMLYSLPASRARNLKENPRKKYKPWNGETFGGSLTFEVNNKFYRIERTFGATESDDTFSLYNEKTNKLSNDFSSNIGQELFGLDSESFSNTTYLPQLDLKVNLTDNISAKLNDLTQDKDDVNSYNNAIKLIDEKRKIYQKTGERGKYYEIKRELETIESQKENFSNITEIIEDLENKHNKLKEKISELETQEKVINEAIKSSITNEKYKSINSLKEEIKNIESEIEKIKIKLHGTVPSLDELTEKRKISEDLKTSEINVNHLNQKLDEIETQIKKLNDFFNNQEISNEKINKINELYNKFQNKQSTSINLSTYNINNTRNYLPLIVSILGIILTSIIFAVKIISPIVFVIILVILLIISLVFILVIKHKHSNNIKTKIYSKNNQNIENELLSLLNFNYEENLSLDTKMHIFRENLKLKDNLTKNYNELHINLTDLINKKTNTEQTLNKFIEFYKNPNYGSSNSDIIYSITQEVLKYNELLKLFDNKKETLNNSTTNIDLESVSVNNKNILPLETLNKNRKEIIDNLNNKRKELSELKLSLERYKLKYDELDELLLKENELKTEFELVTNKLKVLETTDKYLKLAKEELDSSFIKPIADNFSELVSALNAYDIENFKIDTNFNINIEHNGQTKELSFFSKGYQDIAYICARLASMKAMFKQDKPFVILDDPFVNLDKEKLELAKALIKNLAKEYQIIYLVCHDSRK